MYMVPRLGTPALESDFIKKKIKKETMMKALLWVGFTLFSLLKWTESKQHLWLKLVQEAGDGWLVTKTVINGSACFISFSESGKEWSDQ